MNKASVCYCMCRVILFFQSVDVCICREYSDVKDHFRESHFLCEEGGCAEVQFTNAFRSEIDLIGHKAQNHPRSTKRFVIELNLSSVL